MNQEQIHDALSGLPEELIASTAQARTKKKVIWGPWAALAASACLAVALGMQIAPMFRAKSAAPESAGVDLMQDAVSDYYYGYIQENGKAEVSVLLAKVLEVYEGSILVAPLEGEALGSVSRITLTVDAGSSFVVGDVVRIQYDGRILETWPLQLGRVYGIELVDAAK